MRSPFTNVPLLEMPSSTTAQPSPWRSRRACWRETWPSQDSGEVGRAQAAHRDLGDAGLQREHLLPVVAVGV